MTVERVDVLCACDGCGKRFGVELDVGDGLVKDDYEESVKEKIRGGMATCYTWGVRGQRTVDRMTLGYQATVQADLLLCDVCSKKCDDVPIEDNLTREQVNQALGLPRGTT